MILFNLKIKIKKYILILTVLLSNISFAQQWNLSAIPRGRHVNSVAMLDSMHIVMGGGNEFNDSLQDIFLSSDKGLTWDFSNNFIKPWIKSMTFIDTIHGFAVGYTGTILKTINGAKNWSTIASPINRQFNKIVNVNGQTLYIVGGTIPRQDTIQTILKSIDNGSTWNVILDQHGYWLKSIAFSDVNHGVAVGDSGMILRTTDGGLNWNVISTPVIRSFNAIKFISSTVGFIVGGIGYPDSVSTILKTIDAGATWSIFKEDGLGVLNDITFLKNTSTGYIVGEKATVLKTINAGVSWIKINMPNSSNSDIYNTVDFLNENNGVIGGKNGIIYVFTSAKLPSSYTFGAKYIDSTTFQISGGINTYGEDAFYSFVLSTDSFFNSTISTYPQSVKCNYLKTIQASISNLIKDTVYYYYLHVQSLAGQKNGDTLSFQTKYPTYTLSTSPATNIASNKATLNGVVNKLPSVTNLTFEYGTSILFGHEINANPASISDTLFHLISANLLNLNSDSVYYFRLKGVHNSQVFLGEIQTFYLGNLYKDLKTLSASNIRDSSVQLNGFCDKFHTPATFYFEYGQTLGLGTEVLAEPTLVQDSLPHNFLVNLFNLMPSNIYYFRIRAQTTVGTFYGDILSFNTNSSSTFLNTTFANNITNSSAVLNAEVKNIPNLVSLSFEYGVSNSFGSSINATPSSISDTMFHEIYANVIGLQNDQMYYFRLKALNAFGSAIYGDTKQFYTGSSEIPNWDFQLWDTIHVNMPFGWNILDDNFERVAGHSGNYALKLTKHTLVLNGFVEDDGVFIKGVSANFVSRPDSIALYLNHYIETGDTGYILLILKKNGKICSNKFYPITGTSNGLFARKSYKIEYDTLMVPDSIILGFISSNPFYGQNQFFNNYLIFDDISFSPNSTTFNNSGFENWFPSVIERAKYWFNMRYIGLNQIDSTTDHMVSKVYFNAPNDFAAQISNIDWTDYNLVINGQLSTKQGVFEDKGGGFPVKGRHYSLNGYYKFLPNGNDTLEISIDFRKNDLQLGFGNFIQSNPVSEFTRFSVPINYYQNNTDIPDTANISFSCKNKNANLGTKIIIDKLTFDGFYTDVNEKKDLIEYDGIKVYPNPTRDYIIIENISEENKECLITVLTTNGQIVKQTKLPANQNHVKLDINEIPSGSYILFLNIGDKQYSKKIIIK